MDTFWILAGTKSGFALCGAMDLTRSGHGLGAGRDWIWSRTDYGLDQVTDWTRTWTGYGPGQFVDPDWMRTWTGHGHGYGRGHGLDTD